MEHKKCKNQIERSLEHSVGAVPKLNFWGFFRNRICVKFLLNLFPNDHRIFFEIIEIERCF